MSINHESYSGPESNISAAPTAPLNRAAVALRHAAEPPATHVACLWQACTDSVSQCQPVWSQLNASYHQNVLDREEGLSRRRVALLSFLVAEHQRQIRLLYALLEAESASGLLSLRAQAAAGEAGQS